MKIIDGRDPNAVPFTLSGDQFDALSPRCISTYSPEWKSSQEVYIYIINEHFVPAVRRNDTLILCADYKTEHEAKKWIAHQYPHASKIK